MLPCWYGSQHNQQNMRYRSGRGYSHQLFRSIFFVVELIFFGNIVLMIQVHKVKGINLVANELLLKLDWIIYVVVHMVEFYVINNLVFLELIVNERSL